MSKTIKVIDLLNKIANGEETPEQIKYKGDIFNYDDNNGNPLYRWEDTVGVLTIQCYNDLNNEVEIIEEEPEIDIQGIKDLEGLETDDRYYAPLVIDSKNKINELIKAVKQLDNQINNK